MIRTVAPARDAEGLHVEVLGQHNRLNKRPTKFLSLMPRLFCVREKFTFLSLVFLLTKKCTKHTNMENKCYCCSVQFR